MQGRDRRRAGLTERMFAEHPRGLGETYFQHARGAARIGWQLGGAALACFVHAVVPGMCTTRASRTIHRLHGEVSRRTGASPTQDNWLDYEI